MSPLIPSLGEAGIYIDWCIMRHFEKFKHLGDFKVKHLPFLESLTNNWFSVDGVYLAERWIFVRDFGGFLYFRGNRGSRTKTHLSTRNTLSTRNPWTPLISLIYSQLHVTIFPPMAKLFHALIITNNPQFLYSLRRRANAWNVSLPNLSRG